MQDMEKRKWSSQDRKKREWRGLVKALDLRWQGLDTVYLQAAYFSCHILRFNNKIALSGVHRFADSWPSWGQRNEKEHLKPSGRAARSHFCRPECLILISSFTSSHKRSVCPSATGSPTGRRNNGVCVCVGVRVWCFHVCVRERERFF